VAVLVIQDCLERLFFGRRVCVIDVGWQWGVREVALRFWTILLANIEHHCGCLKMHVLGLHVLVVVLFLLSLRLAEELWMPEALVSRLLLSLWMLLTLGQHIANAMAVISRTLCYIVLLIGH
jgi:hypothetical protein